MIGEPMISLAAWPRAKSPCVSRPTRTPSGARWATARRHAAMLSRVSSARRTCLDLVGEDPDE